MSRENNGNITDRDMREEKKLRIIPILRGRSIYYSQGLQSLGMTDFCLIILCKNFSNT